MSWWWGLLRRYPLVALGAAGAALWCVGHRWEWGLTLGGLGLAFLWWRPKPTPAPAAVAPTAPLPTRHQVETYLAQLRQELADLEQELGAAQPDLQQDWQAFYEALDAPLSLAWAGAFTTPPWQDAAIPITENHPAWVLYGVQDQLSASQVAAITRYQQQDQPVQVVWLTTPWQAPHLRHQVQAQLQQLGYDRPLIAITLEPPPVLVRQMRGDGTWEESWEIPSPVLEELVEWLAQRRREPQWQCQAVLRRGKDWQAKLAQRRQAYRDQQARRIIHQYRLWAAVTAGVNPVPSLDVWVTGAINAQMLVDLAQVYRRPLTLAQAKEMVVALGQVLVQMGAVEWVTQAAGTWLKNHLLTYGLGSAVQALSAAYFTQLAGDMFVEHLQQTPERELTPGIWQSLPIRAWRGVAVEALGQQLLPRLRLSSAAVDTTGGKNPIFG